MNLKFIKQIHTAEEIKEQIPFPSHIREIKKKRDNDIRNVFKNEDDRFLLIIDIASAIAYKSCALLDGYILQVPARFSHSTS